MHTEIVRHRLAAIPKMLQASLLLQRLVVASNMHYWMKFSYFHAEDPREVRRRGILHGRVAYAYLYTRPAFLSFLSDRSLQPNVSSFPTSSAGIPAKRGNHAKRGIRAGVHHKKGNPIAGVQI
ncbi:hypothetical protein ARMGADRAFT_218457 [Armillaria gallica]|uniref:Uncharacterized protein n=1 Tax=Armillaria gallica TaxID=47427 RepID=A0A2H3DSC7_ARMGA|nr:hypothetical protein ARMGADRAFT_218457 [Armillaria gallica]